MKTLLLSQTLCFSQILLLSHFLLLSTSLAAGTDDPTSQSERQSQIMETLRLELEAQSAVEEAIAMAELEQEIDIEKQQDVSLEESTALVPKPVTYTFTVNCAGDTHLDSIELISFESQLALKEFDIAVKRADELSLPDFMRDDQYRVSEEPIPIRVLPTLLLTPLLVFGLTMCVVAPRLRPRVYRATP